jgi:hypothetical protein
LTSLDAPLALSSILSSSEGTGATGAAAAFPLPVLLVTVVDSTANVVLGGVLNSPPRFWGVGVDGANGSKSSPPESPAVDELLLLFETPIQLTATTRQLLHCLLSC